LSEFGRGAKLSGRILVHVPLQALNAAVWLGGEHAHDEIRVPVFCGCHREVSDGPDGRGERHRLESDLLIETAGYFFNFLLEIRTRESEFVVCHQNHSLPARIDDNTRLLVI
jgi:hypothetical protein